MFVAPDADLDDGLLDVVMVVADEQGALPAGSSRRCSRARTSTSPELQIIKSERRAGRSADRPFVVSADGDPIGELPVTVRAVPQALRVLVPS